MIEARRFVGWLWLLSGAPIGVALILLPPQGRLTLFAAAVLLETGHSLSPIVMSWVHREFRNVMLERPWKYIALPATAVAITLSVGAATSLGWTSLVYGPGHMTLITDWRNPFPVLVWIYFIWNIYHFGMQNFGVLSLCRNRARSVRQRYTDMVGCLSLTAFGMVVLPKLIQAQWAFLVCAGAFSFNHWIVAIGLCGRVSRHTFWFIAAMLLFGAVGFVWMIPTSNGLMIRVIPIIICARIGLGFWHFLQDRWMWKLSDPQVRATIGRDLR